jgi:hypothetical protein
MFVRLLLTALLAVTLASAQGGRKGGGGRNESGSGAPMMAGRPTRVEQFAEKLKLTKEQREGVQNILIAALEQSAGLRDQIGKGRVVIAGAMIEGKTGDDLKKLMEDYTSLETQMTDLEAKTFVKICALLKPNQAPKGGQAFELMAALLEPAVGGGRGRGGRGQGGR